MNNTSGGMTPEFAELRAERNRESDNDSHQQQDQRGNQQRLIVADGQADRQQLFPAEGDASKEVGETLERWQHKKLRL